MLTGQAVAEGSPWPGGAMLLAVLGAVAGGLVAGLTGLGRQLPRRTLVLTVGGLVSLPLAVAIGQLRQVDSVGIGLVAFGGVVSMIIHVVSRRRQLSGWPAARPISRRG